TIRPHVAADYQALLKALATVPEQIVHLWSVQADDGEPGRPESLEAALECGFYSLLFLAQALGDRNLTRDTQLTVVSNGLQAVRGQGRWAPGKGPLLGP